MSSAKLRATTVCGGTTTAAGQNVCVLGGHEFLRMDADLKSKNATIREDHGVIHAECANATYAIKTTALSV